MKDFHTIWHQVFGRRYSAVRTTDQASFERAQKQTHRCKRHEKRKRALTFGFLGFGAILTGSIIFGVDPYQLFFNWKVTFAKGGEIYSLWEKPPVELYLKVYLWNVTNKEAFMSGKDKKIKLQEVGPYVYREYMTHENVTFNSNGTLTTIPSHPLVWMPHMSDGRKEDDLLILPNIALLSIANVASTKNYFTRLGLNVVIRQTKTEPLVQMTAKEFMFGYKSTLMTLGNTFMKSWIYFDKLGLIDRMYEFDGDYETFYTDARYDLRYVGLLERFNGDTKIPQWDSPCGDVTKSSDGTKFEGNIKPNDTLIFYRKSMCRAKPLVMVNETTVDGLRAFVYQFADDVDDNGRIHKKNRCFCKEDDIDKCLPNGLLDVKGCYYGFPIALSYPHFLDGDEILKAKVESGLNPDPEKHRSFFVIQPESGLPIKLAVRYQINMALGDLSNIANTEKFSGMVLPLLWTEIGMYGLPHDLSLRFRLYLSVAPTLQDCIKYGSLVLGAVFLIYSLRTFMSSRKKQSPTEISPWIEDDFGTSMDKKLCGYIPEKKSKISDKELQVYLNRLIVPPNQTIDRYDD